MKKLILHIGTPKTGTTAIQFAGAKNNERLKKMGVSYPGNELVHVGLLEALHPSLSDYEKKKRLNGVINEYIDDSRDCNTMILSCEDLYLLPTVLNLRFGLYDKDPIEVAPKDTYAYGKSKAKCIKLLYSSLSYYFDDIEVVVYFRRQDEFLNSLYLQHIKHNYEHSIEHYNLYKYELDYNSNLEIWAKYFGERRINVIAFDERVKKEGVERSFFRIVGIDSKELKLEHDMYNITLNPASAYYKKIMNRSFRDERLRTGWVVNTTEHIFNRYSMFNPSSSARILAYEKAMSICRFFRNGNNILARKYCGTDNLFKNEFPDFYDVSDLDCSIEELISINSYLSVFTLGSLRNHYNKIMERVIALEEENKSLKDNIDLLKRLLSEKE